MTFERAPQFKTEDVMRGSHIVKTDLSLADLSARSAEHGVVRFEPPPGLKAHPALDSIRMMTQQEFARLMWSIKRCGLYDPISVTSNGTILDGRCRLMACIAAGVEPRFETVETDDPLGVIISTNIVRAYYTPSQRALYDALTEHLFRDDPECPIRVTEQARVVAQHSDLVQRVFKGGLPLREAYESACEREREAARAAEDGKRLADLRIDAPYLAMQVDEGELTIAEVVEAHEAQMSVAEHAEAIRKIAKRVIDDVIEVGRRPTECKALLGHGGWLPWLELEFAWSDDTALRFMQVYELFKSRTVRDLNMLPVSGLYLLAKPSTPDAVRDDVLRRAQSGEPLSVAEIKGLIDQVRGRSSKPTTADQLRDVAARMLEARPDDPLVAELHRLLFNNDAAEDIGDSLNQTNNKQRGGKRVEGRSRPD
jgi:hypothetical protein